MKKTSVTDFRSWAITEFGLNSLPKIQELIVLDSLVTLKKQELEHLRNSSKINTLNLERNLHKSYQDMMKEDFITFLRRQIEIVFLTILVVLVCLFYWSPRIVSEKFSLVFAVPIDRSLRRNTGDLSEFFLEERIPIKKHTTIIVQNNRVNLLPQIRNQLKLVFRAEFFMISRMGLSSRIRVVSSCLHNFLLMFKKRKITTALRISYRQFLLELPVSIVAIRGEMLDWVATTNSSYLKQHSIFYLASEASLPSYMFWYSENASPRLFGGEFDTFDYEYFRNIAVKEHFVWTHEFAEFLSNFSASKITSIGSILFYPRPKNLKLIKDIDVLIFDVTPFANASNRDFYNYERCARFLDTLRRLQSRIVTRKIVVALKSKRAFSPFHDSRYISCLKDFESEPYNWKFFSPSMNLYKLIARCRLVVGIPFTSAVLIARELGVPSCYLMDSSEYEIPELFNGVPVIQNLEDLEDLFLRC